MWKKEAITDGEIDALRRAALAACNEDTRSPLWRGSSRHANGECLNIAYWLTQRLGGHVGMSQGHYVWLSPDRTYLLDLTGHHTGACTYEPNDTHHLVAVSPNERATRFAKRADRLFEGLPTLIRLGLDVAGDAYPAEEPQAQADSDRFDDSWADPEQYWHDESDPATPEGVYQFIYANGHLEVSPNHSHAELAGHVGINPEVHTGPFAAGHVVVTSGRATWEIQANINLHSMFRILKEATKDYGWRWGGLTDAEGQPIIEDFAPKKSAMQLHYVHAGGHLYLGRTSAASLGLSLDPDQLHDRPVSGTIRVTGDRAIVAPIHLAALDSLFDWAADTGLTLYAGNDNVIKTIPDLQQHDNYSPDPAHPDNPMEQSAPDERLPSGLYSCPGCQRLFPNWHEYSKHRRQGGCEVDTDHPDANGDGGLPEPDPGLYGDGAHFTEMRQEPGITTGSTRMAAQMPCPECGKPATLNFNGYEGLLFCPYCGYQKPIQHEDLLGHHVQQHVDQRIRNDAFPWGNHFPERQGRIVVLLARTWKEAARVDGFAKYAKAFRYDNDDHNFYVAYRNGNPLGYAVVNDDGGIEMVQSAVEGQGIARSLLSSLTKQYASLYTNAAHEKTANILKHYGWVQSGPVRWRWSKDQAATDMLDAPVPFIYDVDKDKIFVGHPGARTSDIPGRFTPGGIVEGNYEPGGKVIIRSLTSTPYTVRHLIELWYYTHPQLEVKSVHLQDDAGKDTRLAATNIGTEVRTYAAMDPAVQTATNALIMAGGSVYAVGGAVRNVILAKEPKDVDVMVTGLSPQKVEDILDALPGKLARERVSGDDEQTNALLGQSFGTFIYRYKGHHVEIALPRTETSTGAGHKDFDVNIDHTLSPEEDFSRRDYTANAMGVNLQTGQFVDPFNGADDVRAGVLRATTDKTLAEDPLRVLRGVVAHGAHGLSPDETTRAQMIANAPSLASLPAERIQHELDKLMESDNPARAIRLAHETGVLKHVLPEVDAAFGFDQNNPHHELELGDHLVNVLDRVSQKTKDPDVRMAALLHDIGKPGSAWKDPVTGGNHFYEHHVRDAQGNKTGEVLGRHHEDLGAELTAERLHKLKYPTARIKRITALVQHHMWPAFSTERGARRLLDRVGEHADDLLNLRWADQGGKSAYPDSHTFSLDTQRRLIDEARTTQAPLAIGGRDLIAAGMPPGPQMGQVLKRLHDMVIDDPTLNNPQTLLGLAKEYARIHEDAQALPQAQDSPAQDGQVVAQSVRRSESQKLAQGDEEAEVEFPSWQDAQEIHDQAVAEQGQPYAALPDPGKLESAMGRAANHYYYGDGSPGERMADAAGALAHGIGMAQAFVDGNKKTAYHTTRYFLDNNGYAHLSPIEHDDEELADHLTGHGEGTHTLEDTQQMFRNRLG